MHTAICTFEDRALAEQAVQRLVDAGFARRDIHLEHRHPDGSPMREEGTHDRDVVGKFSFFERLFGSGQHAPHADTYTSAVERGLYVVIVESPDESEAEHAQNVLHGMEASQVNRFHRPGEVPLRDVVAERQAASDLERSFGTARAAMDESHRADMQREGEFFPPETEAERERAIASQGWGEQRTLKVVDEDKPIASPDIEAAHERDGKPR